MDSGDQTSNKYDASCNVYNDEATSQDKLGRKEFAQAFADLAISEKTQTPLVVGIYGPWGMGKTSFMKMVYKEIGGSAHCVWFDPWRHQFDSNPIIAFMHTIRETLNGKDKRNTRNIIKNAALAVGSGFINHHTGIDVLQVKAAKKMYEEEQFLIQEERVRLQNSLIELVNRIRQSNNHKRLVFFIDDLDRCRSDTALKMLECLKLYLNIEGCVYFLGADKEALDDIIEKEINKKGRENYLEKIVQLPFCLPPIDIKNKITSYVDSLLFGDQLMNCREMLIKCLGHNPRQLKRFINTLAINDKLANRIIKNDYDPLLLSLVLFIQIDNPKLYSRILVDYEKFFSIFYLLTEGESLDSEAKEFYDSYFKENKQLQDALSMVNHLPEKKDFERYLYLSSSVGVEKGAGLEPVDGSDEKTMIQKSMDVGERQRIVRAHRLWLDTDATKGRQANFTKANLSGASMSDIDLSNSIFNEANLFSVVLDGATLSSASFKGAFMEDAVLSRAILKKSNFSKAILAATNFEGADLTMANLSATDLEKASFADAKLEDAILCRARLGGVDFSRASMSRVDLTKASLVNSTLDFADLSGAILDDADLSGASLNETILDFADLRWVSGLELLQLKTIKSMKMTKFHPKFWQILKKQYPQWANLLDDLEQVSHFIVNSITLNKLYEHAKNNDCNITEKIRDRFVKSIFDLFVKLNLHSIGDAEQYLISNFDNLKKSFEVWRRISGTKSYPKDGLIIVILILGSPGRLDVEEETKTWRDPYQKWMLLASSEL